MKATAANYFDLPRKGNNNGTTRPKKEETRPSGSPQTVREALARYCREGFPNHDKERRHKRVVDRRVFRRCVRGP